LAVSVDLDKICRWSVLGVVDRLSSTPIYDSVGNGSQKGWNYAWNLAAQKIPEKAVEIEWNGVGRRPSVSFSGTPAPVASGPDSFFVQGQQRTIDISIQGVTKTETRSVTIFPDNNLYCDVSGPTSGTLAAHIYDTFNARINGLTPSDSVQNRWSNFSARTPNTNCFLPQALTTGLVAACSASGAWGDGNGGAAVTPRHCVFAAHFGVGVNSTICFVTGDGTKITRTVTSLATFGYDIQLATLNADLPSSIEPVQLLPANYASKLSPGVYPMYYSNRFLGFYGAWVDRDPRFCVRLGNIYTSGIFAGQAFGASQAPNFPPYVMLDPRNPSLTLDGRELAARFSLPNSWRNWQANDAAIGGMIGYGDSGGPNFLLVNNKVVLLHLNQTSSSGPSLVNNVAELASRVSATGHALTFADFSGFPDVV
jgi:hypothetical protein